MDDSKIMTDTVLEVGENSSTREAEKVKSNDSSLQNLSNVSKTCTFFSKFNNCKYGRNCKFKHCTQSRRQLYPPEQIKNAGFHDRIFVSKSGSSSRAQIKNVSSKTFIMKNVICRYYKAGNCGKGDNCSYKHSSEFKQTPAENANIPSTSTKKKRVPICHYFKKGNCHRGEDCKFYHSPKLGKEVAESSDAKIEENNETDVSNTDIEKLRNNFDISANQEDTSNTTALNTEENNVKKIQEPLNKVLCGRKLFNVSNLSADELDKLRDIEIVQLKKRYPKHVISEQQSISFTFEPSDPDWPFDLKTLCLEVNFPEKYPLEECEITVALSENNIPDMLIRHLNQSIKDFIAVKFQEMKNASQVELIFRPFLKWFDRNLEDLFICGLRKVKRDIEAKKHGIEFVPPEELFSSNETNSSNSIPVETLTANNIEPLEHQGKDISTEQVPKKPYNNSISFDNRALKQGIKVLFNGLELVEGIATFSCSKLSLTVHCIRCKTSCNIKCTPGKGTSSKCSKCSKVIECCFNPTLMHQFSNVAGNLHVIECQIVDINLVESCFGLDCLNCSKHITIDGLHYGQKQKRWCTSCNEKLIFSIENVKFQATSSTFIAAKNAPVKKTDKKKDPLFKEGEPLPDYGTCKHYKKSYRWLRFPCCGRLYPCDICHNEKEKDHEMKFASRMICGFCSKEQPYSKDKPCSSCSGSMTAKSGVYWEGGKGCRSRIKMARDDKHKYSGTSKTVSRKAQSTKGGMK